MLANIAKRQSVVFFILFEKLRAAAITKPLSLVYDTPGVERSGIFAYMNGLLLRNAGKIIYCVDLGGCSDGKCANEGEVWVVIQWLAFWKVKAF